MMAPETIAKIRELMKEASVFEEDLEESFILGGGPGGQKTNKTSSVVRLFHAPSGLQVRVGRERSRETNRWLARRALAELILERALRDRFRSAGSPPHSRSARRSGGRSAAGRVGRSSGCSTTSTRMPRRRPRAVPWTGELTPPCAAGSHAHIQHDEN